MTESKGTLEGTKIIRIPSELPVLPVRNTVVFPNASIPLVVGRSKSLHAVDVGEREKQLILVVAQRDPSDENPSFDDLYKVGTVCLLSQITRTDGAPCHVVATGLCRFVVEKYEETDSHLIAHGERPQEIFPEAGSNFDETVKEVRTLLQVFLRSVGNQATEGLAKMLRHLDDIAHLTDLCATVGNFELNEKQELLECFVVGERLEKVRAHLLAERERLAVHGEIQSKVMERLSRDQREHLLREQLKTIHEELGDEKNIDELYRKKIKEAQLSPEALKVAQEELARLGQISRSSPEYHVIRTYLDWICALPWRRTTALASAKINLKEAKKILDADHDGLEKVKKRILQHLAVTKLQRSAKGPILCLVGPPGVGKTSIGKAVADALGRKFVRVSLGGVRDEAEIRGHRRTYVGALPGRILQSLKRAQAKDALFLLDEIDKIGTDFRGDPASALLEALDPEQNHTFLDHYLDVPFDLSQVFFIATANILDPIPRALLDRLEVIEMSSYSFAEKKRIARAHLFPKLLTEHGLEGSGVSLSDTALDQLIEGYTREAGVRQLGREMAAVLRSIAEKKAENENVGEVSLKEIRDWLGPPPFYQEVLEEPGICGVATGLAWTPFGGEILRIEVSGAEGKGQLQLTGQLGDVMKESAHIAMSLVRVWLKTKEPLHFDKMDMHIHVPKGAIPKDGPSAGVALFLALASFLQGKALPDDIAYTGEITLRGKILPVGGIKEKVLAAHRAGVRRVVMPERNRHNLIELSADVQEAVQFNFVDHVRDLIPLAGLSLVPPAAYSWRRALEAHAVAPN